jgi:hypothetical protein
MKITPEWITSIVAIFALAATVALQIKTQHDQINKDLLEHRRKCLFEALQVIDHVYSNEPIQNGKAPNPHKWDIQLAHDADNELRIYCKYPETVRMFRTAIGLYNPTVQKAPGISLKALDDFRRQVAKELDLPEPVGQDENAAWIGWLSGTTQLDPSKMP